MKKYLLLYLIFNLQFSIFNSSAQPPLLKQWDYRYGGTDYESLYALQKTLDGGFILGGYSLSGISGDKTQASQGVGDYWILKTDANGLKLWDARFGGADDDELYAIAVCRDGGFILAGYSYSGISGDKTQPTQGLLDYWVVKTDSLGNKLWDKVYGGLDYDYPKSIQQTSDGGYIIGGYTLSGIGGDKTQVNQGFDDYWIVKTDSLGNKLWDKDFGGDQSDDLFAVRQTPEGGYILAGYSYSGISGDKTQPSQGGDDYWIVKTDSVGNKIWDRDFGSGNIDLLYAMNIAADGGYILGGVSQTGASGDKTQPGWGGYEWWVVKTDSAGNKLWNKDFGGTQNEDDFNNIENTSDGGFLFSGTSYSDISGVKTENNLGNEQSWIIKTDSLGNIEWDKTLHTNSTTNHDEYGAALEVDSGCFVMGNYTRSGAAGDKSQTNWNNQADLWIIKFCDTTLSVMPVAAFAAANTICPGTCTSFANLSLNAISYQWNFPGATPSTSTDINPQIICYNTPGNYDVQLIATGVNGNDTLTLANYITVYPFPPPQGITQTGDTLIANQGSASYQWYYNGTIITVATEYFYVATQNGDYNVVCTDSNSCEVEAVIFDVVAGIESTAGSPQSAVVYPNPVNERLEVRNWKLEAAGTISIYNMLGEMVLDFPISNIQHPTSFDVSQLPQGMYWLELIDGKKIFRSKFVKQ